MQSFGAVIVDDTLKVLQSSISSKHRVSLRYTHLVMCGHGEIGGCLRLLLVEMERGVHLFNLLFQKLFEK